jgi:hypothetical protein
MLCIGPQSKALIRMEGNNEIHAQVCGLETARMISVFMEVVQAISDAQMGTPAVECYLVRPPPSMSLSLSSACLSCGPVCLYVYLCPWCLYRVAALKDAAGGEGEGTAALSDALRVEGHHRWQCMHHIHAPPFSLISLSLSLTVCLSLCMCWLVDVDVV